MKAVKETKRAARSRGRTERDGAIDFALKPEESAAEAAAVDDHVYRVIEIVGSSPRSIEAAIDRPLSRSQHVTQSALVRGDPHQRSDRGRKGAALPGDAESRVYHGSADVGPQYHSYDISNTIHRAEMFLIDLLEIIIGVFWLLAAALWFVAASVRASAAGALSAFIERQAKWNRLAAVCAGLAAMAQLIELAVSHADVGIGPLQ